MPSTYSLRPTSTEDSRQQQTSKCNMLTSLSAAQREMKSDSQLGTRADASAELAA